MKKRRAKRVVWVFAVSFALMNAVAFFHAYTFTHFSGSQSARTQDPGTLTAGQKIRALAFGVSNPRPQTKTLPACDYQTVRIKGKHEIECWSITAANPKGTVILFHGFSDEKSSLLDRSVVLRGLGYNTLLADFMGSGGSGGNRTTVGFREAGQVKACFDYVTGSGEGNVYLFGTSMGAAAIMKAISDYAISPEGVILECPFGTMYQAVRARFRMMRVPAFPMAGLLTFWGGAQNGFWAFAHNPADYAKKIDCPALLLYGAKDEKVSRAEIDAIYNNLPGRKKLAVYPEAGHGNHLTASREEWARDIRQLLSTALEE